VLSAFPKNGQSGFSLIELMIGIVIMTILVGIGLPSFQTWLQNTQIRNAAESIANGLQRARAEAVSRNTNVEFVLGAGSSWVINVVGGAEIESRSSSEGSKNVVVTAVDKDSNAAEKITYTNLGGVVPAADALAQVDLDIPGDHRNLRIVIGVGGNARMCDPNVGAGPSAC
jgi:type IV fimbrial biogenesis protein FimT